MNVIYDVGIALHKFVSDGDYWLETWLVITETGTASIEIFWRNPELAGVWTLSYPVTPEWLLSLCKQGFIEPDSIVSKREQKNIFKLSAEGTKRLSKC